MTVLSYSVLLTPFIIANAFKQANNKEVLSHGFEVTPSINASDFVTVPITLTVDVL